MATAHMKRNRCLERPNAAATEGSDLGGSQGRYSSQPTMATHAEIFRRYTASRSRKVTIGKCVLAEKSKPHAQPFRRGLLRMREIERIIKYRHGSVLPGGYGEQYLVAMAHALHAHQVDVRSALRNWCARFAPWLTQQFDPMLDEIVRKVSHRVFDLHCDAVANLLELTFQERQKLGIRTIGACDISPAELRRIMKDQKMQRDRERQRANRKAEGRKDRDIYEANSLSRTKPWETLGMSRSKFYRLRKAGGTSVSPIVDTEMRDTPVSLASKLAIEERRPDASAASQIQKRKSTEPWLRRVAKPPQRSEEAQQSGASPRGAAVVDPAICTAIEAALQRLHDPSARWLPATGSSTDVIAA